MKTNKNAVVNKVCHSQEFLLGIFHVLSRYVHKGKNLYTNDLYVGPSGMTTLSNKTARGFTLIELLVVVLIIGILAAVAVPQYQKAVYKSRAVEAITMLKAITQAEEVYYLANNEYTDDISKLDVEVPVALMSKNMAGAFENKYSYGCSKLRCDARVNNANMPSFQYNFRHIDTITAGFRYCHLKSDSDVEKNKTAKSICQSMGKVDNTSYDAEWFNDQYFILN